MRKLPLKISLATMLFASACQNPNSSTSEERETETPTQVEEHGAHKSQQGINGADTLKVTPDTKVKREKTEPQH